MPIPQVADHLRRAPTLALRAVFAGVGRILMAADRPQLATADDSGGHAIPAPRAASASNDPTPGAGLAAVALPMPRYDELTLASIRARLRSLDASQLRVLADYERGHAERPEVLGMLERRIEKVEAAKCR